MWGKKDGMQGQWQKILMISKARELSTNVWRKTGSVIPGKVTPDLKTNQDYFVEDAALLEMVEQQWRTSFSKDSRRKYLQQVTTTNSEKELTQKCFDNTV